MLPRFWNTLPSASTTSTSNFPFSGSLNPHGIELRDGGEEVVGGVDIGAFLDLGEAGQPGERRRDGRVGQIELGLPDAPLRGQHGGARRLLVAHRVVEVPLGHCVLRGKGLHARQVRGRDLVPGLLLRQLAARLLERRLEGLLVHEEEHLPFLDEGAFRVHALLEKAVHARANLHLARALRLANEFVDDWRIARLDGDSRHIGDGLLRRRCFLRAAGDQQRASQNRDDGQSKKSTLSSRA
jgi:hypothetical protein